jgi:hypothetical protein
MSQFNYENILKLLDLGTDPRRAGQLTRKDISNVQAALEATQKIFEEHAVFVQAQKALNTPAAPTAAPGEGLGLT